MPVQVDFEGDGSLRPEPNPQAVVSVLPFGRTAIRYGIDKITKPDLFQIGLEHIEPHHVYGSLGALLAKGYPSLVTRDMLAGFTMPDGDTIQQTLEAHNDTEHGIRLMAAELFGFLTVMYTAQRQAAINGGTPASVQLEQVPQFVAHCAEEMRQDETFADFLGRRIKDVSHDETLYRDDLQDLRLLRGDRRMMKGRDLKGLGGDDLENLRDTVRLWIWDEQADGTDIQLFQKLIATMYQHLDNVISDSDDMVSEGDRAIMRTDSRDLANLGFYFAYWTLLEHQKEE